MKICQKCIDVCHKDHIYKPFDKTKLKTKLFSNLECFCGNNYHFVNSISDLVDKGDFKNRCDLMDATKKLAMKYYKVDDKNYCLFCLQNCTVNVENKSGSFFNFYAWDFENKLNFSCECTNIFHQSLKMTVELALKFCYFNNDSHEHCLFKICNLNFLLENENFQNILLESEEYNIIEAKKLYSYDITPTLLNHFNKLISKESNLHSALHKILLNNSAIHSYTKLLCSFVSLQFIFNFFAYDVEVTPETIKMHDYVNEVFYKLYLHNIAFSLEGFDSLDINIIQRLILRCKIMWHITKEEKSQNYNFKLIKENVSTYLAYLENFYSKLKSETLDYYEKVETSSKVFPNHFKILLLMFKLNIIPITSFERILKIIRLFVFSLMDNDPQKCKKINVLYNIFTIFINMITQFYDDQILKTNLLELSNKYTDHNITKNDKEENSFVNNSVINFNKKLLELFIISLKLVLNYTEFINCFENLFLINSLMIYFIKPNDFYSQTYLRLEKFNLADNTDLAYFVKKIYNATVQNKSVDTIIYKHANWKVATKFNLGYFQNIFSKENGILSNALQLILYIKIPFDEFISICIKTIDSINLSIYQAWGGGTANTNIKNVKYLIQEITFQRKRMDFYTILNKKKLSPDGLTLNQFKYFIGFSSIINTIFNILKIMNSFEGKLIFSQNMVNIKLLIDGIFELLVFYIKNNLENSYFMLNDQYLNILNNLISYYPQPPLVLIYQLLMTIKKNNIRKLSNISTLNKIIEEYFQNVSKL